MSTRMQISLSAGILVVALAVTAFTVRSSDGAQGEQGMEGHDHAAMMAGAQEQSPVVLDAEAARRIGVTYATVEHRVLPSSVNTVGTVVYDETRLAVVNPKISGWVESLHVDFTGAPVRAGDPLMDVYSPALVSAQEELILAARLVRDAGEGRSRDNATALLESARRRMAYWDIPEEEIRRIEESGEPSKALTLRAPMSGVVVEKNVVEGDRIMSGMTVFRVADLSRVWVEADVFEKDLAQVREGQEARVRFEAFPGQEFRARVTYVYPTVSVQARTGRIRLELPNPTMDLRPGMYAEISLDSTPTEPTLVVPRSAVIETGQRALVFVLADDGALMPREVTPGRTEGRSMEILDGLRMGERVVSSAAFLVDAESNLGTMTGEMDMSGMETEEAGGMEGMDHSTHDMGAMETDGMDMSADTAAMDHSTHDMGAMETDGMDMSADTAAMDHSTHDMGAMEAKPDTSGGMDPIHHD